MNVPYSLQPNTLNITNTVQDIPAVLISNRPNELQMYPITMPPTTSNENPLFLNNNNIQAIPPSHSLQPTQDYLASYPCSLTHHQETTFVSEYSFFYKPYNDFQMYHIVCEEIPLSYEFVARLINNPDLIRSNKICRFYHEQPEIKKIYQVTCKMVPHAFIFQFLNKIIYNIQSTNGEYQQQQEFSVILQENLKFHLKRDLIHYLMPKSFHEESYYLHKRFVQDYCKYESIMDSKTGAFNTFQHQCFTSQGNLHRLQNDNNDSVNYDQHYYKNQT
ncbi:hypothetical protein RhiirA5_417876 [Rhizophagus irregularis]|uniref:Uncharacterized protein n=3 Tax=Rhizophagus irregularis TaxID=588596 RepID=U9UAP0_RHIID|nr:hypothetical protein GLOIN_2v1489746 [Rhizophagus irregularis DAOM 181602=DAOM 197198]EXX56902.1 hypothetical protein RirG_212000 [Rhizophagus irregularis DAOM 197198w]PKC07714.1 hypothetical protein RhiirA5_417876 [Rhizophagus irregularis]PKC68641.1 hypothetical protein RhiirA1_534062 [Rhizophagus irregularis]PKY22439.1 hypothetical protein RhiirB3_525788 [Rhizophagus irregularis]POG83149.1 hypothetical protein GLOIN_2v1489746 [Rhizophagus irregularis DAOM 181602=DAOM 197198]|eukprot:XP_025190015.1 hypothetical protein GLOIN_2v1489746 [Rhizophagus irregularis DAOM 181602=DAOM 197198]